MLEPPEPGPKHDTAAALVEYLDYFRDATTRKVLELSPDTRQRPAVPTTWTAEEILTHLLYMERRWIVWGFCGKDLPEPFAESAMDGGWRVIPGQSLEDLVDQLAEQGRHTGQVVANAKLTDSAAYGGRFHQEDGPTPTLLSILLHVLQEYARHAGHLDIACETLAGITGE